jgi:hypothetical protein
MKVFISWSGQQSRDIASALRKWLPYMLQPVKPFLSSGDIRSGKRWSDVLAEELKETKYGIVCLTRYNALSQWLNFEAGALSKEIGESFVSPFLFGGLDPVKVQGPLSQFQASVFCKEGTFDLVSSINSALPDDKRIPYDILRPTFEKWWPDLQAGIDAALGKEIKETETNYKWLFSVSDLVRTEGTVGCRSVCVISPNPLRDWHVFRATFINNLLRSTRYQFILPATAPTEDFRNILKNELSDAIPKIPKSEQAPQLDGMIICVEEQTFNTFAATHYRVLNFQDGDQVFLELPIQESGYWLKAEGNAVTDFTARFEKMKEPLSRCPPRGIEAAN